MTKQFSNYSDLLTFTRASKGHALRPVSYGSELVTNGDFSSSDGWTSSGWTISSGQATVTGTGANKNLYGTPASNAVAGKLYQLSYEVITSSVVNGSFRAGAYSGASFFGGSFLSLPVSVGTHKVNFIGAPSGAGSVLDFWLYASATSGTLTIDNVSVKEVTFDESDGTLTLFEHPDNIPRVEWDADRNRLGLLVEEARTNLITYSTPDSNWSTSALGTGVAPVVTLNNESAPDGTLSAAKLVLDTGAGTTSSDRSIYLAPSANVTATNSYSGSVWLKGEVGGEQIVMRHAGNATYSAFTLTTSWARYEVTETASSSLATMAIGLKGNQSDLTATIYVWGAQVEAGSFPTSYIKTTGATATRSADVASIPVADFGYNQSAGTMLIDYLYQSLGSGELGRYLELNGSNPSQDRILLYLSESSENTALQIRTTGGGTQTGLNVSTPIGQFNKVAGGFSKDDVAAVSNGGSAVTDTLADIPANIVELDIGASSSNIADVGVVYIKSIQYYPRRLTNAQLQDITS